MPRQIDQTPRPLTRTNWTSKITLLLDRGEVQGVSVDREQVVTDSQGAVVSRVHLHSLTLDESNWPGALAGVIAQLRNTADAEEAARGDPPLSV